MGEVEEIPGAIVYWFKEESLLLQAFDQFISNYDPDVITGYNILNFDLRYLLQRREAIQLNDMPFWGRLNEVTNCKESKFNSKIMGF